VRGWAKADIQTLSGFIENEVPVDALVLHHGGCCVPGTSLRRRFTFFFGLGPKNEVWKCRTVRKQLLKSPESPLLNKFGHRIMLLCTIGDLAV
jgi:hypothetical protein